MTINLKEWANKKAKITFRSGKEYEVTIHPVHPALHLPHVYWVDPIGSHYNANGTRYHIPSIQSQIIKIEPITMNTKELQKQIEQTQLELNKLQEELKKAEEQEKFNSEFYTQFEDEISLNYALRFLKENNILHLEGAFTWSETPQGENYWVLRVYGDGFQNKTEITQEVIQQIKDWVINYLIQTKL